MKWLFFLFVLLPGALGHGLILYDVDLSFDPQLQTGMLTAGKKQLGQTPITFDFEYELITAKANTSMERSATFSPVDFSLYGERDDVLGLSPIPEIHDQNSRKDIAQKAFVIHARDKSLVYGQERKLYNNLYEHTWYRRVDGILVLNEHFKVEVNAQTGDIVAWRQTLLSTQVGTKPAFSAGVAEWIALLSSHAKGIQKTEIIIYQERPLFLVYVTTQLYPTKVGIDGLTGEVLFVGPVPGDMPDVYVSSSYVIEPNNFIKGLMK